MSIDYQDALLKDIHKDLLLTNSNLKESTAEVVVQGKQLVKIQGDLDQANDSIKRTDKTMFLIEWRERCYRLTLYAVILMEFITIVVLLLYKIFG